MKILQSDGEAPMFVLYGKRFLKKTRCLSVLVLIVFCFVFCEFFVRFISRVDDDGNYFVRWTKLIPYRLPVRRAEKLLSVISGPQCPVLVYDPYMGWASNPLHPNYVYPGVRYHHEHQQAPVLTPSPDVLRIALFGDSYTASYVKYIESWGNILHELLNKAGIRNEVINFGVGGYGVDQAYIRWRYYGRQYRPNLVIFGFQPENIKRNLNLIRLIY